MPRSIISFDMIVRYLRYLGYKVRYVQNITDVGHLTDDADEGEDKILKRAAARPGRADGAGRDLHAQLL